MALGCEMILQPQGSRYEIKPPLRKWPLATKSRQSFEIDLRNGGGFAKTPCEAKGSCENANKALHHASEEERPAHPEITHMKSLIPFLTSLNHQSP